MMTTADYRIELDVYHGPLDLLLYLIKRDEIDIHDIPIARVTEQFMRYVETLRQIDIEAAGDFLVMAATLMEIKSAMMLPREEQATADGAEGEVVDAADPRFELVQQLLAYKRFKDAAAALDERRELFNARFPRKPAKFDNTPAELPPLDLEDISIWDLFEAFSRMMEQVGHNPRVHKVVQDDTPIELHATDIIDRLHREGGMTLQAMFAGRQHINDMIGLFLATLELVRQRKVRAYQDAIAGEIRLEILRQEEAEPDNATAPKQYDPANPEHFDWPDEETKKRYVRRQERRARGEFIEEDAELDEDIKAIEAEENAPAVTIETAKAPEPQVVEGEVGTEINADGHG
jgi:segregation and condensation protein A